MAITEERQKLAQNLSPYDDYRQRRLAATALIDVAIGGRKAALRRPRTARAMSKRQAGQAARRERELMAGVLA